MSFGRGGVLIDREKAAKTGYEACLYGIGTYFGDYLRGEDTDEDTKMKIRFPTEGHACGKSAHRYAINEALSELSDLKPFTGKGHRTSVGGHVKKLGGGEGGGEGGFAYTGTKDAGTKDSTFLVCFQGTTTIQDVKQDLKSLEIVPFEIKTAKEGTVTYGVGKGFKEQFDELGEVGLIKEIDAVLKDPPEGKGVKRVKVVGHSLGGALACLAAVYIIKKYPDCKVFLHTLGAPRVFEAKDADTIQKTLVLNELGAGNSEVGKTGMMAVQRMVNYGDVIPSTPQSSAGFKHFGRGFYINQRLGESQVTCKVQHQDFSAFSVCGCACFGTHKITTHSPQIYLDRIEMFINKSGKLPDPDKAKAEDVKGGGFMSRVKTGPAAGATGKVADSARYAAPSA